jgi:N-succinyldiaminopimelate aminotransferase
MVTVFLAPSVLRQERRGVTMANPSSATAQSGTSPKDSDKEAERSPFARLADLLAGHEPAKPLISLSLGEPQHPIPDFVGPVIQKHLNDFGRYPIAKGIEAYRKSVSGWLSRRFTLPRALDPESEILVLNGSREGLFFAAIAARRYVGSRIANPAILLPNPFYPVYGAGAVTAGCETILLGATAANGFLPELDSIPEATLKRAVGFYMASPANPQGTIASKAYFAKLNSLAQRYGFIVLSDECYSEIYTGKEAPGSALEAAGPDYKNVAVFQSLSKRSNLPGMRVGFAAGDKAFLNAYHELRNVAAPQVPVPLQYVGAAAYDDEAHVEENRRLYRLKFDLADQILGNRYGYKRPGGGFCVWLDISAHGSDEAVALKLFREGGVRVIPGSYLARVQPDGSNPGKGYIRLALVQDSETTAEALHRIVDVLG